MMGECCICTVYEMGGFSGSNSLFTHFTLLSIESCAQHSHAMKRQNFSNFTFLFASWKNENKFYAIFISTYYDAFDVVKSS